MYGQQCKRCDDESFRNPRWYKEEVTRVLNNVHQKIGEVILTPSSLTCSWESGKEKKFSDVVCIKWKGKLSWEKPKPRMIFLTTLGKTTYFLLSSRFLKIGINFPGFHEVIGLYNSG